MEEWIKELTASLQALQRENAELRSHQQQQQQQQQQQHATTHQHAHPHAHPHHTHISHVPSARMRECRPLFEGWRVMTSRYSVYLLY